MHNDYTISQMTKEEVSVVIDWARKEGWNPGLHDADCFYQTDPNGFFAGKLNGKIIAIGSAVNYDEQFAFCGFYRVDPAYRGKGYGLGLTKARLAYIGKRNAGIDGVVNMLEKYSHLGYRLAYHNARYHGEKLCVELFKNQHIVRLNQVPLAQLVRYDRLHFPALRERFLSCWINQEGGGRV